MVGSTTVRRASAPGPVRVVHLITTLDTGGAEAMLHKLLGRLDPGVFDSSVVSLTDEGSFGPAIRELSIGVCALGMRRGVPDPRALLRLRRELARSRPHILLTWMYHADLLGTIAARMAGVPVLAWSIRRASTDWRHLAPPTRAVVGLLARLSSTPDVVLVNSHAGREAHLRVGYRPRRWELIPNGFDTALFRPCPECYGRFRAELGVTPETLLVGLVARYDPVKDHDTFLRAASRLRDAQPQVHFVLAGSRVDASNCVLTSRVRELGLAGRVHLLGNRRDLPQVLPALDVLALSSVSEGMPNIVGEAMAAGVPCVVTRVGDAARLVGDTGYAVEPRDAEALAAALSRLLALGRDGRRRLGESARQRIQTHFGLDAVCARYAALLTELGARARAAPRDSAPPAR
ncbi:MAG: glycosyltransferase [Gemmatimonadetes bacterium]|nr:glycosyltransferase [Gemmatimonadota bacterium]